MPHPVRCHAVGCTAQIGRTNLFCLPHWGVIPVVTKDAIHTLQTQPVERGFADAWFEVLAEAITSIARAEGRDPGESRVVGMARSHAA